MNSFQLPVEKSDKIHLGFQDEFMEHFDEFSDSWRDQIRAQHKF